MRRFSCMFNLSYYFRKKIFDQLPEPSEEEEDMLDLAWGLTHTSRLGCQIIIDDTHEGMRVKVPFWNKKYEC